jgi:predicted GNAT family N-acyltransferase
MVTVKEITTSEEQSIVFDIRRKVFIIEQCVPESEEYDEFETKSKQFLAFINDLAVGTARMRQTEKGIKLERFAVLKEFRGRQVGASLVKNLLTKCKNELHSSVYLYAQVAAKDFYEKFGFEARGEIFLDAGIDHIEMQYQEKRSEE